MQVLLCAGVTGSNAKQGTLKEHAVLVPTLCWCHRQQRHAGCLGAPAGTVHIDCSLCTWMDAETKKNCCFSLSSFPYSVASLGYSTALISSALRLSSTACSAVVCSLWEGLSTAAGWTFIDPQLPRLAATTLVTVLHSSPTFTAVSACRCAGPPKACCLAANVHQSRCMVAGLGAAA